MDIRIFAAHYQPVPQRHNVVSPLLTVHQISTTIYTFLVSMCCLSFLVLLAQANPHVPDIVHSQVGIAYPTVQATTSPCDPEKCVRAASA